ncbi:uncharacterized protein At2g38710-like isoform X3 [Phoenix dactylifera]|uniref:Uncharacterized protein At2g38710-like isoform X3 n=1 Tax=Phoenix dactylifera TaxID=42345 RepID=A0A8B8J708_PHODC|nr:uncharacterized protein At2g38710-like isoform X3 [Phoenix dactylifera]
MVSANREMAVYCFDTLVAHYNSVQAPPPAFEEGQHPLFVTWKKAVNGGEPRLRGCIGTLEARCLINGFKDYALTSALRDRRFPPIQAKELPYLECTVSVLTNYESALHYLDWEIGKHGLIIEFTDPDYSTRCSATYLPEVAAHEGSDLQSIASWYLLLDLCTLIVASSLKLMPKSEISSILHPGRHCDDHVTKFEHIIL